MTHINLKDIAIKLHENAKAKGFYDREQNIGERMMLVVSELSEGLEAHRKRRNANLELFQKLQETQSFVSAFEECVKDTIGDELADAVIRLCDFCGYKGITISLSPGTVEYIPDFNFGECLLCLTKSLYNIYFSIDIASGKVISSHIEQLFVSLFSIAKMMDIDLPTHITLKMKYNETRPAKHGKEY